MKRYEDYEVNSNPRVYRSIIYPAVPRTENDIYILSRQGDRLDLLAANYYDDISLWWIIVTANSIGKGSLVVDPGLQIRIPMSIDAIIQSYTDLNDNRG